MKSLQELEDSKIRSYLDEYKEGIDVFDREASYYFCYNYFRKFCEDNHIEEISSSSNIEVSCLQLGFYLASWGMYRGSGELYYKSVKVYEEIMKEISKEKLLWKIDVDNYNEDNIDAILKFKNKLQKLLGEHEITATDTLITKIMMGVFGCVPAFDSYFIKGLKVKTLNEQSLTEIKEFYDKNQDIIDSFHGSQNIITFDVTTKDTGLKCKKAKIIDMIGFTLGDHILNKDAEATK